MEKSRIKKGWKNSNIPGEAEATLRDELYQPKDDGTCFANWEKIPLIPMSRKVCENLKKSPFKSVIKDEKSNP